MIGLVIDFISERGVGVGFNGYSIYLEVLVRGWGVWFSVSVFVLNY